MRESDRSRLPSSTAYYSITLHDAVVGLQLRLHVFPIDRPICYSMSSLFDSRPTKVIVNSSSTMRVAICRAALHIGVVHSLICRAGMNQSKRLVLVT